ELVGERARPAVEDVGDVLMVGDAEGKVQVGEAVAGVYGERAHEGSGDDVLILLREHEHALAESIPLLNGEHQVPILALHGSSLGGTHPPRHSCPVSRPSQGPLSALRADERMRRFEMAPAPPASL